jgi:hypothetical protein
MRWLAELRRPDTADYPASHFDRLARANRFHRAALTLNRRGRLSQRQRLTLLGRVLVYSIAMIIGAFVGWVALSNLRDLEPDASVAIIGGVLLLAFASLVWRAYANLHDALRGQVLMAEGIVRASYHSDSDSTSCYYHLGKLRFRVSEAGYHALEAGRDYRLYYAPHSKSLVNIEPT